MLKAAQQDWSGNGKVVAMAGEGSVPAVRVRGPAPAT
jgi:hypothetical protein